MPYRYILAFTSCLASACLDTHDASLGHQEPPTDAPEEALDGGAPEGGAPALDAAPAEGGAAALDGFEDEGGAERDASSLLCRLEPWHCT